MKFISLIFSTLFLLVSTSLHAQEVPLQAGDSLINTKWNETKPALSPNGQYFYFTRSNDPQNVGGRRDRGDVFVLDLSAGRVLAQRLTGANSKFSDKVVGFNASGNRVYLMHNDEDGRYKKSAGLYSMPLSGGTKQEETVNYFFNKARHQDMSISPDGNTLIMSLESYSTYGLEDLYVSFKQANGSWSEPQNLGNTVNSKLQEMGGYLAEDGRTLYFTSNRPGGLGSLDVYRSVRQDNTWKNWSEPQNLGVAINTSGSDFDYFFPVNGNWAYYVSTQNSEGFGDIKRIKKPNTEELEPIAQDTTATQPEVTVANDTAAATQDTPELEITGLRFAGRVVPATGGNIIAKIRVSGMNNSYLDSASAANSFNMLLPEAGPYTIAVSARGYFNKDTTLTIGTDLSNFIINLEPITVGATVRLDNVMFQRSTAILLEGSYPTLDRIVNLLEDNPGMEILLTGHTDNQGSSRANLNLSRERVEAVKDYLVSRGVEKDRIEGKGYGGTRPVASNANEESRKLNRRVEFTVLKND